MISFSLSIGTTRSVARRHLDYLHYAGVVLYVGLIRPKVRNVDGLFGLQGGDQAGSARLTRRSTTGFLSVIIGISLGGVNCDARKIASRKNKLPKVASQIRVALASIG